MIQLQENTTVVGVDVHKYSHTAVALDPWGQEKGKLEFSNDSLPAYAAWLRTFGNDEDIIVALEDVNCYGVHIVDALRKEGFPIRYVPAILTERKRKHSTKRHKSDYADAKRVGKVILTNYEETLPARESIADEEELTTARALDLLLMERRDLVKQKTILKNQLHALLHQYYGDHYADQFVKPFGDDALTFFRRDLDTTKVGGVTHPTLAKGITRRIDRLETIEEQVLAITDDIIAIGSTSPYVVALSESIHGCGMLTACAIIAEVVTIKRFTAKANFAMYAGIAPTEHSSGQHGRLHTNPFGNRRLNRALHTIVLSQISRSCDTEGKTYYRKKLKEGKTKLWAMRCLKRHVCNRVFTTLKRVDK